RFVEMFGDPIKNPRRWKELKLKEGCESILGGGTPSKSHPEYFVGKIPWVTPKDMKKKIIRDSSDHITEEAIEKSSTKLIPTGSVLMVIRSGILKHDLPLAINAVPVTINQDMKAFVPKNQILKEYLLYYFNSIESDVLSKVRAVTADNIDFKEFQKRRIPIPPIELQQEFASFVQQVDKSK
ncbi:restriction endonuclease subunit S, partial [Lactobacillus delbrueckii subsp. bulgaricus]